MVLIADYVDFDTAEIYNQKSTKACTAFSFFTLLSEYVQQEHGLKVEFDILKEFDKMEKLRGKKRRVWWLFSYCKTVGFKAKSGELVKIKGYRLLTQKKNFKKLSTVIQQSGPLVFVVHRYNGHKLNPKDTDIIESVKPSMKKKNVGHAMMVRGFDHPRRLIKFQNSWGDNSIKWMPLDVWQDIIKYGYYIEGGTVISNK